jgi:spore germination cell wall hydrolase CwlJ-like protein
MTDLMGLRNRKFHEILAQQAASPAPTPSWGAALARALQGGVAGLIERGEEGQQREALAEALKIARGDPAITPQQPQPTPQLSQSLASPPAQTRQPLSVALGGQKRPVQVIEGNAEAQPSPLDPPAGAERDQMIRLMHAEARGEPPEGQQAVANVIRSRAVDGNHGGSTATGVMNKPWAFEPMMTPQGRQNMASLNPNSPQYQQYNQQIDRAYAGDNPVGGAVNFFAPKPQAALGRPEPSWARGRDPNAVIGGHKFYGGADQGALPPEAQLAQGQMPPQMAQPQQSQMPQAKPGLNDGQLARIEAMSKSKNPAIREMAGQALQSVITNSFKPADWDISHRPDGAIVAANKQNPNDIRVIKPPGRADDLIDFDARKDAASTRAKALSEREVKDSLPGSFEDATKLRSDVRSLPSYKNISEAAPIYKTMLETAGRDSKASDLNLVYGLGKIFDPGSVVREGEMVMVKNTASLPDWLVGSINSLNGGARLQPETRKAILAEAHSRMNSYSQLYEQESGMYRGIAERNRIRPEDVIHKFGPFEPWAGPGQAQQGQQPAPIIKWEKGPDGKPRRVQ